jgi:hypothetical protein
MILQLTNRMVNGQQVRVINPNTNEFLDPSASIDLDTLDFSTRTHYERALLQGDLVEVVQAQPKVKGE